MKAKNAIESDDMRAESITRKPCAESIIGVS
jgi:hypothetical protein